MAKKCFVQFVEFADLSEAVCVLSGQQLIRFQVSGSVFVIFPVMAAFGFRDQIIPGEWNHGAGILPDVASDMLF